MDLMSFLSVVVLILVLIPMIRWHLRPGNEFNLMDLVCTDGHLNDKKFLRTGAWAAATWGFVWLVMHDKMTEWYFVGYLSLSAGISIVDKWQRGKEPPSHPAPKPDPKEGD